MLNVSSQEPKTKSNQWISAVKKQAIQSNLFAQLLKSVRSKTVPQFLVNRAAANGLPRYEFEMALKETKQWVELPHTLAAIAQSLCKKALYWQDLGLQSKAASHYFQSALWDFYAQLLTSAQENSKAMVYARSSQNYRRAVLYFDYPALAVDIPYQSGFLKGYLRLPNPDAEAPYPCTIIINQINSSKEELHYTENAFLKLGIATLSFDLPGSGESTYSRLDTCDLEILGNALFLFLAQQEMIDTHRLALHGLSLGGSLALHLAWQTQYRYRALATLSAPYDMRMTLHRLLPSLRREIVLLIQGIEDVLPDFADKVSSPEALPKLQLPMLVAGGGKDIIVTGDETKRIYESAGSHDKKLLLCPTGRHNCFEMMPSLRHEIAQWIKQRI